MIRAMGLMAEGTITACKGRVLNFALLPGRKIRVTGGAKVRAVGDQKMGILTAMGRVAIHTAAVSGRRVRVG